MKINSKTAAYRIKSLEIAVEMLCPAALIAADMLAQLGRAREANIILEAEKIARQALQSDPLTERKR